MKKLLYFLAGVTLLGACKPKLEEPVADFDYSVVRNGNEVSNPDTIYTGEIVTFTNTGSGDNFAIYTGAPESDYTKRYVSASGNQDTNLVSTKAVGYPLVNSNNVYSVDYAYSKQGVYNMVFVANTIGDYGNEILQQINDDKSVVIIDSIAILTNFSFKKPSSIKNAIISMSNLDGDTVLVRPMMKYAKTPSGVDKTIIKFQASNSVVTEVTNNASNAVKKGTVSYQDTIDLSGGKSAFFKSVAPNGITKYYEIKVGYYDRVLETGNELSAIKISGDSYTADTANNFTLMYPFELTSAEVSVTKSANSKMFVDDKEVTSITVADLIGKSTITIESEVGEKNGYTFTIDQVAPNFADLTFKGASGFPLDRDDTNGTIDVILASSFQIDSLFPEFDVSKYTQILYGADEDVLDNGATAVDFTSPVDFTLINGTDTSEYKITVTQ